MSIEKLQAQVEQWEKDLEQTKTVAEANIQRLYGAIAAYKQLIAEGEKAAEEIAAE